MSKSWTSRLVWEARCWKIWLGRRWYWLWDSSSVSSNNCVFEKDDLIDLSSHRCAQLGYEFKMSDDSYRASITITCGADRSWNRDSLPPCECEMIDNPHFGIYFTINVAKKKHLLRFFYQPDQSCKPHAYFFAYFLSFFTHLLNFFTCSSGSLSHCPKPTCREQVNIAWLWPIKVWWGIMKLLIERFLILTPFKSPPTRRPPELHVQCWRLQQICFGQEQSEVGWDADDFLLNEYCCLGTLWIVWRPVNMKLLNGQHVSQVIMFQQKSINI